MSDSRTTEILTLLATTHLEQVFSHQGRVFILDAPTGCSMAVVRARSVRSRIDRAPLLSQARDPSSRPCEQQPKWPQDCPEGFIGFRVSEHSAIADRAVLLLVPKVGLEPTLPCGKRILSPPRLPFRHFGFAERFLSTSRSLFRLALSLAGHLQRSDGLI
jgi:hypothetical protein